MKAKTLSNAPVGGRVTAGRVLIVLSWLAVVASLALWLPIIGEIERYRGFHTARLGLILSATFLGVLGSALAAIPFLNSRGRSRTASLAIASNITVGVVVALYACWPRTREVLFAVYRSDETRVKLYSALGADLNGRERWGWHWSCEGDTPLTAAVWKRDVAMVKTLLACGANLDATDGHGDRPIDTAISANDPTLVVLLLEHGAKVNYHSTTALGTAAGGLRLELIDLLLANGADPSLGDPVATLLHARPEQMNALSVDEAAIEEAVRKLAKHGADLDCEVLHNRTLLTDMLIAKRTSAVKLLVECGVDVDREDGHGDTSLIVAAMRGDLDSVRFLLAAGADPNKGGGIGKRTPLVTAIGRGELEIAKLLLANGADINQEGNGYSPTVSAVKHSAHAGNPEMLQFVLDHGGSPTRTDFDRNCPSPLAVAAESGDLRLAGMLLDGGAPPDEMHEWWATPLLLAIKAGHLDVVKLLVSSGADVNRKSPHQGVTPLGYARQFQRRDIEAFLREQGAVDAPDLAR